MNEYQSYIDVSNITQNAKILEFINGNTTANQTVYLIVSFPDLCTYYLLCYRFSLQNTHLPIVVICIHFEESINKT